MKAKSKSNKLTAPKTVAPETDAALFIDKRELAKRLGLKPRTISGWALQGKIPAYRFGRFLRFRWNEVEQALAAKFRVGKEAA